jgi:hypothetical protein
MCHKNPTHNKKHLVAMCVTKILAHNKKASSRHVCHKNLSAYSKKLLVTMCGTGI